MPTLIFVRISAGVLDYLSPDSSYPEELLDIYSLPVSTLL